MSVLVSFGPVDMTKDEYLRVGDRLPDPPKGRDYHVCAGENGALYFIEVWDSREAMEAHNEALLPTLQELFGSDRFADAEPENYAERDVVAVQHPGETFRRP